MGGGWVERTLLGGALIRDCWTAEVWRSARASLKLVGRMTPSVRSGETEGRKRDWRVDLMEREPDGAVTMGNEG